MKIVHRIINLVFIIVGIMIIGQGVHEFSDADKWLELLRGLFWIVVGCFCFWGSLHDLIDGKKWYE